MFEVKVLGTGCPNCKAVQMLIEKVCSDNDITINLEKVEDEMEIMQYGIMSTPGVVVDNKIAHAGGANPDAQTVLGWFKSKCCPTDNTCC